jgi:tRNA (cytidine/uridine-2'-O-)-methyltransferase
MKIVLFQPQIPQNTGNIIRTCSVTGASLVLVKPLGFSTSSRMMKRSSLDYASEVQIEEIDDLATYLEKTNSLFYFFSSKVENSYSSMNYPKDALLIFGSETSGLPQFFLEKYPNNFATIPMKKDSRCLNLSNAVSIVLYEALRQQKFDFEN